MGQFPVLIVPEWVHDNLSPNARHRLKVVRRIVFAVRLVGWLIVAAAVVAGVVWVLSRLPQLEAGFINFENLMVISVWLIVVGTVIQTFREAATWVVDWLVRRSLRQFVSWGRVLRVTPEIRKMYREYREKGGPKNEELLFRVQRDYGNYVSSLQERFESLIP